MNPLTPGGLSTLSSLLRSVFGSDVILDSYKVGNRREDYIVLLASLRCPDMAVVIKLAGPDAPIACPFEQTAWVHELVRTRTTVPVAEVLAADTSYSQWPWRYMIKEYIDGVEWADLQSRLSEGECEDLHRQIAHSVAELHTITFAHYGELPIAGATWQTDDFVQALAERARRRIANENHFGLFSRILTERAALFSSVGSPCLCHEDLHKHNIIFREEGGRPKLVNILDFDSAWAGCHESDLARLEMWNSSAAERFIHSYKELHAISDAYPARRPIFQLLWCLEYASETARHLADTARVCAELGIEAISSFGAER